MGRGLTMATRECFSSQARYHASVSSDAILLRPIGSNTLPPVSGPVPSLRIATNAAIG